MGKYYFEQLYWALETGYLNLSAGVPDPIDGSDVHQAFNPCHKDVEIPKPMNKDKIEYTSESVLPNFAVSYTEETTPGSGMFPNGDGMDYRDPFLGLCVFPHKETSGTWAGGAATYGTIIADFTDFDDVSSIMMQYGLTDGTTPINRCLNGIRLVEYALGFVSGGVLKEKPTLQVADSSPNTQAFVPAAGFDDGQWANWAQPNIYPANAVSVYWDDAHAAEFAGLEIQECWMLLKTPYLLEKVAKNLYYSEDWMNNVIFEAQIKGIMTGNAEYLEIEKAFNSKLQKDLRMIWDETASEEKYLQFPNAVINKLDSEIVPSRSNIRKINLTILGDNAQYSGSFENLADPTTRIDLSP